MSAEQPQTPGQPQTPLSGQQPDKPQGPRFRISWWWVVLALVLLVVNYAISSQATRGTSRSRVPYSPFFLEQVRAGNVEGITSKGTAIQGALKEPRQYESGKTATKFKTEIPAFADTDQLAHLL